MKKDEISTPSTGGYDDLLNSLKPLGGRLTEISQEAVTQYTPVAEDSLRSGSRDVRTIEQTLDGLLDFCDSDPALQLYRRLCRHYFSIDPAATAYYVRAYREMWDSGPDPLTENPS
ncbi:MAG: hypothetical protein ABSH20_30955 [Tepidisphaeraceae bacterium]